MKKWILLLFATGLVQGVLAQSSFNKGIIYNHELSGGAFLHTSGWGIFVDLAHRDELKKKTMWEFSFSQLRNPKEVRQTSNLGLAIFGFASPKPYVFGKQNNFYQLSAAYGKQLMITERAEKSGVELGVKLLGGFSLGLLKPYYLDIIYPSDNANYVTIQPTRYSPESEAKFLDPSYIYGGAGFVYGLGEISFWPGIHLKSGLNFDWAENDDAIKAIEVGATLDAYLKEVPIMIADNNRLLFPNIYLELQFGKKW